MWTFVVWRLIVRLIKRLWLCWVGGLGLQDCRPLSLCKWYVRMCEHVYSRGAYNNLLISELLDDKCIVQCIWLAHWTSELKKGWTFREWLDTLQMVQPKSRQDHRSWHVWCFVYGSPSFCFLVAEFVFGLPKDQAHSFSACVQTGWGMDN